MMEQNKDVVSQDEEKKEKFKELISSVGELAEQVGIGEYDISEENRGVSDVVARALDSGITDVKIKRDGNLLRIRTNDRGYGAKADFSVKSLGKKSESYYGGAGGGMPGETYRNFKWHGSTMQFGVDEMWSNPKLLDILVDTVYALTAVYDLKNKSKNQQVENKEQGSEIITE